MDKSSRTRLKEFEKIGLTGDFNEWKSDEEPTAAAPHNWTAGNFSLRIQSGSALTAVGTTTVLA